MNTWISIGNIGKMVKAKRKKPNIIVGKYQIKLEEPNTIGEEIINPNIAFLESVRNINDANKKHNINNIIFLEKGLLVFFSSDMQNGQTITIHKPA